MDRCQIVPYKFDYKGQECLVHVATLVFEDDKVTKVLVCNTGLLNHSINEAKHYVDSHK